jgi:hypothetical protein
MKRMALSASLILALVLAMPAFTWASDGQGENTPPHQIAGVLEGTIAFVPFPNATSLFDVDALGEASGVVKGLGRTIMFTFHRPLPDGTGVTNGRVRIVTASQDTIKAQYIGTTVWGKEPNQIIGNVDFVVTGGTGRFADASGTIHATAYVTFLGFDVFEWPVTWVLEGIVNY